MRVCDKEYGYSYRHVDSVISDSYCVLYHLQSRVDVEVFIPVE